MKKKMSTPMKPPRGRPTRWSPMTNNTARARRPWMSARPPGRFVGRVPPYCGRASRRAKALANVPRSDDGVRIFGLACHLCTHHAQQRVAHPRQEERRRRHVRERREVERGKGREDDQQRGDEREREVTVEAGGASAGRCAGPQHAYLDRCIDTGEEDADERHEPEHTAVHEGQQVLVVEDLVLRRVPGPGPPSQPEML